MSSPVNRRFALRGVPTIVRFGLAAALGIGALGTPIQAQHINARPNFKVGDLEVLEARPNVHIIFGAGGNIVVHDGWMGIVLVDTGAMGTSDKVMAAIKELRLKFPDGTDKKIRFIINTGGDPEHVGGNEALSKAGINLLRLNINGNFGGGGQVAINSPAAEIMANENVLKRMSAPTGQQSAFPTDAWPTESFTAARTRSLYLNGDGVQMVPAIDAHTDADTLVSFKRSDVIAAGDVLDLRHFPIIDEKNGGTIMGEITALNRLIDLSVAPAPFVWAEDRTLIIPGHGRICGQGDVVEYRDMITIVKDRVEDLMKKGQSLDQIKKANTTNGYNKQYGSDKEWTSEQFVTSIYNTLKNAKATN